MVSHHGNIISLKSRLIIGVHIMRKYSTEKIYSNVYITSMAKKYYVPRPVLRRPAQFRPSRNPTGSIRPASRTARNTAPRLSLARTRTLLLRKTKQRRVKVTGTGGQVTSFNHIVEPTAFQKGLMKNTAPNYYNTNFSYKATSPVGFQGIKDFPILSGGAYAGTNVASDLAAIQKHISGTANLSTRTQRYLISKCHVKYLMTNQSNGNVNVDIYDVACRNDTSYGAWNSVVDGITTMSDGASNAYNVGLSPTASTLFTAHFKILQKSSLILAQGQSHTHQIKYAPNKLFKSDILTDGDVSLRNFTMFTLIVFHGMPTNDLSDNVSVASTTLDIVCMKQLKWYRIEDSISNYHMQNNLPVLANQEIINIGTGLIDEIESA